MDLICISLIISDIKLLFIMLVGRFCVIFEQMAVQVLGLSLIGLFGFLLLTCSSLYILDIHSLSDI